MTLTDVWLAVRTPHFQEMLPGVLAGALAELDYAIGDVDLAIGEMLLPTFTRLSYSMDFAIRTFAS